MFQNVWMKSTQVGHCNVGVRQEDERKRLQNEIIEDEDEKSNIKQFVKERLPLMVQGQTEKQLKFKSREPDTQLESKNLLQSPYQTGCTVDATSQELQIQSGLRSDSDTQDLID